MDKYNDFRKLFNRMFSLSVNGKFKGLYYLLSFMDVPHFEHFIYKLTQRVTKGLGHYRRPLPLVFTMKVSGVTLKLYSR